MANAVTQLQPTLVRPADRAAPSGLATLLVVLLVMAGTLGGLFGGPSLGDHEAIVAECARNMRQSGDWIVPEIFDTPFFRKPPLPYWLIAAVSYVLPNDAATGLPVSVTAARLPSAAAGLITVLLLWHLASRMFDRRVGLAAGLISGSSVAVLLYSPNATVEMLLAMCCTWAYVHFWHAATARGPARRFVHAMLFYVAMGMGMLAKGPAPIALVAMPLAFWWYSERPLRVLSRGGLRAWRRSSACLVRGLWPRTVQAFTRLWLLPGLLVFAAVFVPWMLAVAARHEHAWDLWNWQYWQRAQGNYEDTRPRGFFYYMPVAVGLTAPWLFLLFEGLASPWLRRYARWHRPLLYAGTWSVLGVLVMSLMAFKKPYYILPALPGLLLLMAVVARRVGDWKAHRQALAWSIWALKAAGAVAAVVAGHFYLRKEMPTATWQITLIAAAAMAGLLVAGGVYIRGRGWLAMGLGGLAVIAAFHAVWYSSGPAIDAAGEVSKVNALAAALDEAGMPREATLYWADRRPAAWLDFAYDRRSTYLVTPDEVVSKMVDRTGKGSMLELQLMTLGKAKALLESGRPVYLVLQQRNYEMAKESIPAACRELATVGDGRKAWVVVTNAAAESHP